MELIVYFITFVGQILLHMLIIAIMAIPAGIGLAIGYKLGKVFYGLFEKNRSKKYVDFFKEVEVN